MARRVPKPLVPVLVAVAGIGIAFGAALPSFAGPNITPPANPTEPAATAPAAPATPSATPSTTAPAPAPPTTTPPPAEGNSGKGDQGPKDCSNCGVSSPD